MQAVNVISLAALIGSAVGAVWGLSSDPKMEFPSFPPGVVEEVTPEANADIAIHWGRAGYERINAMIREGGGLVQAQPDCDSVRRVAFDSAHSSPPTNIVTLVECANGELFKVRSKAVEATAPSLPKSEKEVAIKSTARPLQLAAFSCRHEYGFAITEGAVKNQSANPLSNVTVVVQYYDAANKFIGSTSALIEFDPLLPGQTSPFKVIGRYNPAQSRCYVGFKQMFGGTIPYDRK